jgi:hypothetical protein
LDFIEHWIFILVVFKDSQKKEETLEQTDILEITTGTPSKKKHIIQQQNKQKNIEKKKNLNQQVYRLKWEKSTLFSSF